jgi:hypothetical protein
MLEIRKGILGVMSFLIGHFLFFGTALWRATTSTRRHHKQAKGVKFLLSLHHNKELEFAELSKLQNL